MSLACECLSVSFIQGGVVTGPITFNQYTTDLFPGYGYESTFDGVTFIISWDSENEYWALSNDDNESLLALLGVNFDECPYGTFIPIEGPKTITAVSIACKELGCECIRINVYLNQEDESINALQFQLNNLGYYNEVYYWSYVIGEITYFIWFDTSATSWVISSGLGVTVGAYARLILDGCPFGEWIIYDEDIASIISFECPPTRDIMPIEYGDVDAENCDSAEPCKYSNLLKRNRVFLSKEISAISKREVYGFNCEDSWKTIFTKSMVIDALSCLPYGVYTEEEERCLIEKLNDKCDC